MALTRKFLSAMGIDADKIDEIITAHTETVNALKNERDEYKAKAEENQDAKDELDKASKELDDLKKKLGDDDSYKEEYDKLKKEYDDYKADVLNEKTQKAKESAYKNLLKEIGISEKRIDKITKLAELDKIELDKDGNIKKVDDLKKSLTEEWSEFIPTKQTKGADTSTPPTGNGGDDDADTSYASDRVAKYMAERYGTVKKD